MASILQGCGQSVPWTRALLYDVLERAHYQIPGPTIRTWVDDIRVRLVGSPEALKEAVPELIIQLCGGLADLGCRLS
eukprot:35419-Pyramimonas_sp.AAC.1